MGVSFSMFAFEWVVCFWTSRMPMDAGVRLFDTYIAQEDGFTDFHLYCCAAFAIQQSPVLRALTSIEDLIVRLTMESPVRTWTVADVELVVADAAALRLVDS